MTAISLSQAKRRKSYLILINKCRDEAVETNDDLIKLNAKFNAILSNMYKQEKGEELRNYIFESGKITASLISALTIYQGNIPYLNNLVSQSEVTEADVDPDDWGGEVPCIHDIANNLSHAEKSLQEMLDQYNECENLVNEFDDDLCSPLKT